MQNILRRLSFHLWYYRQPPWDTGISPPELLEFIDNHTPARAIDLGCGTGTNVITLARAGWQVTGVDYAPRAIALARRKIREAGIRADVLVEDVTRLKQISGPFDLAFDLGCYHGIAPAARAGYLEQLDRILAPGGFWLLYGFFRSEADEQWRGLTEAEIAGFSSRLTVLSRQEGVDDHRHRASAWFLFRKKSGPRMAGS